MVVVLRDGVLKRGGIEMGGGFEGVVVWRGWWFGGGGGLEGVVV